MAFFAFDVRGRAIQRVAQNYNRADNKRVFLIEARSRKLAWAKARRALETIGSTDCVSCDHRYCSVCEECSVAKQYSDYWICHSCGGLSRRVSNLLSGGA
jgi:hypothetical protein